MRVQDDALQLSFATGIALDREGSIYVSGYEIANDNDVTSNTGDATYLVFKLDSSANLLWHTYVFGGRGDNSGANGRGLAVDSMEDVYLVGYASVALDNIVHLGETDAFIMQFDGNTGAKLWTRQSAREVPPRAGSVRGRWESGGNQRPLLLDILKGDGDLLPTEALCAESFHSSASLWSSSC